MSEKLRRSAEEMRESFKDRAAKEAFAAQESSFPYPEELEKMGVKTESVFNHRMTQQPDIPHLRPTPNDPVGWETARRKAKEEHQADVARQRREFRARFEDHRQEFNTRGKDRDRELDR